MTKELTTEEMVVQILEVLENNDRERNKVTVQIFKILCALIAAISIICFVGVVMILKSVFV